ncbi:unnamed protein product, partial [marine sediment metagenome]
REWGDYAKALASGGASLGAAAAGLGELGARGLEATGIPGVEAAGEFLKEEVFEPARQALGDVREDIHGSMSAAGQAGTSREYASLGENSIWRNLTDVPLALTEQIPMALATLVPIFRAGTATSAMIRGATIEGGLTTGFVFDEIANEIDGADEEAMYSSEAYQVLREANISHEDARDAVKTMIGGVAVAAGVASGITGGVGGKYLHKLFRGDEAVARSFFKRFIQGYFVEAGQEASQESIEQLAANAAAKVTHDPDRDISENVGEAAVAGGFLG